MDNIEKYEKIFKALSDKIRLSILKKLMNSGKTCVCELVDEFELSQSKLSYHLKLLLDANLIIKSSEGKWNYYCINEEELNSILTNTAIENIFK